MKIILITLLLIIGILISRNGVKRLLGKLGNPNEIMEKMHIPYVTDETAFYIIKMLSTLITLVTYFAILILLFFLVHLGAVNCN